MIRHLRNIILFLRNFYIGIPSKFLSPGLVLGTNYGKKFLINKEIDGSNIISAGVGRDISWDEELAKKFEVNICLIDPTPISNNYIYEKFEGKEYIKLPNSSTVFFYNFALWKEDSIVTLYPSQEFEHNDFSIHNLQKTKNTEIIKTQSFRVISIMKKLDWNQIDIIKLDIEGAALEVLKDMFKCNIYPKQILIEIDELFQKSFVE